MLLKRRTQHHLSALADLDLLADCGVDELEHAASLLTPIDIAAGEVLLRQDTVGREFLIVASGQLAVTRSSAGEAEFVTVVESGSVVGEMSLINRAPRSATVTTLTPVRLYAGTTQEFFAFLDAVPTAGRRILAAAQARERSNRAA